MHLEKESFQACYLFTSMFLRRRQKEKRINPPNTSSGGPSSPASPPSMASPGGFFGAQPGGSTTPPTSLTPYSGSPGKNEIFSLYGSFLGAFGNFWELLGAPLWCSFELFVSPWNNVHLQKAKIMLGAMLQTKIEKFIFNLASVLKFII